MQKLGRSYKLDASKILILTVFNLMRTLLFVICQFVYINPPSNFPTIQYEYGFLDRAILSLTRL